MVIAIMLLMKRITVVSILVIATFLTIGVVQNYITNPTRGCKEYDSSTQYIGYKCKGRTLYIKK